MTCLTESERQAVVAEAMTWIGTPFHHAGRIKSVGVDCAMFPLEVYSALGLIPALEKVPPYPVDWHLHRSEERYLETVLGYADETDNPQPGDFVLFRFGRCFSHGAILLEGPRVVHAYFRQGVIEGRRDLEPLASRPQKTFTVRR